MQFQTTPQNLLSGITTVQRAVSPKSPLAVLTGILLNTPDNKTVTLTASNGDLTISSTIPASASTPGRIVLPAKQMLEIVRRLPDVPLTVKVDPETNSAYLNYGRAEVKLNGYNAEEFPPAPEVSSERTFKAPCGEFRDLLRRVIYAAGQDDLRPIFTGVLLEIYENEIRAVATDTHRLAHNQMPFTGIRGTEVKAIIGGKTLSEVVRILGQTEEDDFSFSLSDNYAVFQMDGTRVVSRTIVGDYPDYKRVIPADYQTRISGLNGALLLRTVERAAAVGEESGPVLNFKLAEETLVVSAQSEAGFIREEISVQIEGEEQDINFNSRYLEEALRWYEKNEIIMEFNGSLGPAVIKPGDGEDYLALVLPVRLS